VLNFAHPGWLFGLLFLPLLGLLHWQQIQRERAALEAFAREGLWQKMDMRPAANRRWWRGVFMIGALALGLLSLSQPRWGDAGGASELGARQGNLVILLDVSKSMLTRDLNGNSRLSACQHLLGELLPQLAAWKIGVVAFAGDGLPLVPLTTDHAAVETLLQRAQPGQASGKGSNMEAGLKSALGLFTQPGRQALLVLSDGEELKGYAAGVLPALSEKHVQVVSVGAGTHEGGYVPAAIDLWGNPAYMTYRGDKVTSRLREEGLKRLAEGTDGGYWSATDAGAPAGILQKLGAGAPLGGALPQPAKGQGFELFQIPLALAFLLLIADAALGLVGRGKPELRFGDLLRDSLGRASVAVLWMAIAVSQGAWTWYPTWLPNREAAKAYETRDYDRAAQLLEGALKADPNNFRLMYNAGNVYYQQGNWQMAINAYGRAWDLGDEATRPTIGYNLGNAYVRQGDAAGDPKAYAQAIAEYERVLQARPQDADARYNLEVAKRRLKQAQQKQQGQQGQSGSSGGNGNPQTPIGVEHVNKAPAPVGNLPSEGEVDALLKALESDERQRQAEQAADTPQDDSQANPFSQGGNLLQQALGSLDLEKDW
jgi:Ca-activated chloride channel family protein